MAVMALKSAVPKTGTAFCVLSGFPFQSVHFRLFILMLP